MVKGVCILSYKHEILHKDAFGCAISYVSKRQAQLIQYGRQIQDGRHPLFWRPSNACTYQSLIIK